VRVYEFVGASALLLLVGCVAPRVHSVVPESRQETAVGERPSPARDPAAQDQSAFEQLERGVTSGVRQTAAWIDRFLSDQRSVEEENRSWVAVRLDTLWDEGRGIDPAVRTSARIVLPRTEEKVHLVLNEDADKRGAVAIPPAVDAPAGEATSTSGNASLALQFFLKATQRNNIRFEAGVRFEGIVPDPYVGARWRHELPLGTWRMRMTERLRTFVDAGVESVSTVDFERPVTDVLFFRATTSGTWRDQDPSYDAGQRFDLFQRVDESRLLTYEWDNAFVTDPARVLDETALRVRLSERFSQRRLLVEIAPQIAWRRDVGYEPSYGIFLRIELSFGREE
jgi:hypothetical protein